jgi:hypothetical protein
MLTESLKTVNRVHQLIIAVSAAIIAFGISPNKSKQYEAALRDVATLKQLSMNDYDRFSERFLPKKDKDLAEHYASVLKQAGYPKTTTNFEETRQAYFKRPNDESPLTDFFKFFEGDSQIVFVHFNPTTLRMRQPLSERREMYRLINFRRCEPQAVILDTPNEPSRISQLQTLILLKNLPKADTTQVQLAFDRYVGDMNCGLSIPANIDSAPVVISGNHAAEWRRSKNLASDKFLRSAKALANQIGAKSPSDAARFLEEKANTLERELSFLGIAVQKNTVV